MHLQPPAPEEGHGQRVHVRSDAERTRQPFRHPRRKRPETALQRHIHRARGADGIARRKAQTQAEMTAPTDTAPMRWCR